MSNQKMNVVYVFGFEGPVWNLSVESEDDYWDSVERHSGKNVSPDDVAEEALGSDAIADSTPFSMNEDNPSRDEEAEDFFEANPEGTFEFEVDWNEAELSIYASSQQEAKAMASRVLDAMNKRIRECYSDELEAGVLSGVCSLFPTSYFKTTL